MTSTTKDDGRTEPIYCPRCGDALEWRNVEFDAYTGEPVPVKACRRGHVEWRLGDDRLDQRDIRR